MRLLKRQIPLYKHVAGWDWLILPNENNSEPVGTPSRGNKKKEGKCPWISWVATPNSLFGIEKPAPREYAKPIHGWLKGIQTNRPAHNYTMPVEGEGGPRVPVLHTILFEYMQMRV